jgi:hypothetical protein
MGLPDDDTGGPGGGGMGLPDDDTGGWPGAPAPWAGLPAAGAGRPGAGAAGRPGPDERPGAWGRPGAGAEGRGGRGARAAGAASCAGGRGRGGSGGRGARAAGACGGAGAAAGGLGASARRGGTGGRSPPDEVTSRGGGPGGRGEPAGGMGRPGGGPLGRGIGREAGGAEGLGGALDAGGLRDVSAGRPARSFSIVVRESTASTACSARSPAGDRRSADAPGRLSTASPRAGADAAFSLAGALAFVDVTGSSGGCSLRTRPSFLARRRTRSACASSMPDECVLTPMPSVKARSRASLFVSPSSLASSWTRIFAAKFSLTSPSSCCWARTAHALVRIAVPYPRAVRVTGTNTGFSDHPAGRHLHST